MKKILVYSIMFFMLIGSLLITNFNISTTNIAYAYTDNITDYRASLAYINEHYNDCISNRLIIKSNKIIQDTNAVCMASGFAGLNIIQYENEQDALSALEYYSSLPYVEYVEQDVEITINDIISYDNNFTMEGLEHLSWGSELLGIQTYHNYILKKYNDDLPEIYVAVLDTGIDTDNEFLKDRIAYDLGISYYDSELYLSSLSSYKFEDDNSHGTHVAGTIVDLTMDNIKIIPIKVLNGAGSGSMANVISGMEYVLSLKNSGTNICAFNMSLSGYGISSQQEEIINNCYESNIMPVVAAGNDNYYAEKCTPANCENALTISALSQNEFYENFPYIASYSNYGDIIDLCLPGSNILSCVPNESTYSKIYTSSTGGKYAVISGTSMATPHATALVALYATYYDDLYNVSVVEEEIKTNTYDFGDLGKDELYGYGVPSMALAINKYELTNNPTLNYGTINSNYNFDGELNIEIINNNVYVANHIYKIYYTLDGSYPTLVNFNEYNNSITINESSLLRFVVYIFDEEGNICGDSDLYEINYFKGNDTLNSNGTGFEITSDGIIKKYTSGLKNIILPEYVNGIKVKGLAQNLFYGLNIDSFVCNYDISIGYYPFVSCSTLKLITLNSYNAEYVARNCFALKELNLPNIAEIKEGYAMSSPMLGFFGSQTFSGCFNLEYFTAPQVIEIKDYVFSGFEKLKMVSINWENLYRIGEFAFESCSLLNIDIESNNLIEMGRYAFKSSGIKSFKAENLKIINEYVFNDCKFLQSLYVANINTIYSYAIFDSNNLQTIFLGDNDLKLYTDSLTSSHLVDFTIYCYNPKYISNFTTKKCVDITPTIKNIENDKIKIYINGYNPKINIYRSIDNNLSQDDILVNTTKFVGLHIDTEFSFEYLDSGSKNYILVISDMYENQNVLYLNKTGTINTFDIMVESNIGECGLVSSSFSYYANENVELKLNEINGYRLNSIMIDGVESSSLFIAGIYNFTMPDRDIEICLNYSPIYYNISLNIVGDGLCSIVDKEENTITFAKFQQEILLSYSSDDSYVSSIYYITDENKTINLAVNNNSTSFVMPNSNIQLFVIFKTIDLSNFIVKYDAENKTFSLSSYTGNDTIVQIPQYITRNGNQYRLNKLNDYCFYNNNDLEQIEVQFIDNNKNIIIGENVFGNCINLKFINVGDIVYLDDNAFNNCVNLKMINIENCEYIGKMCFYKCRSLTNINLSNCYQMIDYAFAECTELESVIITNTLKIIPNNAFQYCYNLNSINLSNVEKIGTSAFWECRNLTSVDLSMCNELMESTTITNWSHNFYMCTSLKDVLNPIKLNNIPANAFANCYSLENFDLSHCESLGAFAFSNCNKLVDINLSSIKNVSGYPFTEVKRLIFGSNSNLISANELELTFYLFYIYIDKDYIGELGDFIVNNFTYSYEIENYKVYTKLSSSYVTFMLEDGTIINQDIYSSGDYIKFPTNYKDNVYSYSFVNWINEKTSEIIEPNNDTKTYYDIVYVANDYNTEYIEYSVKFYYGYDYDNSGIVGDDGDIFYFRTYHYGDLIQPLSLLPLKASDVKFDYTFKNWINNSTDYRNDNLPSVSGDMIFNANYQNNLRKYSISWYDGDNVLIYKEDVEFGLIPEFKLLIYGNPQKTSTDANNIYYTFNNWSPIISEVIGEYAYYAEFQTNYYEYVVKFYYGYDYNEDGEENNDGDIFIAKTYRFYDLIINEYCEHAYIKLGTIYTFNNWSINVNNKTPEQLYSLFNADRILAINALYDEEKIIYNIRWFDGQDELIYIDYLTYGELPEYKQTEYGAPKKNQTNYNFYVFDCWDKELLEVTNNIDYYAEFIEYIRLYDISWLNGNNEIIYVEKLPYESDIIYDYKTYGNPTKNSTDYYKYKFVQWSNLEDNEIVLGNKTFISEYKTYNKINLVDDNYQIVDISTLSSINSITIDVGDINNDCKLELKHKNVSILLNETNISALKTGNVLVIEITTNYEQLKKEKFTQLWDFTINMLLDNVQLKTLPEKVTVNLNCLIDANSKLYIDNEEIDFTQINTDTISFNTDHIGKFIYGYYNSNNLIIILLVVGGVIFISVGIVISIVALKKRKHK